MPAWAGRLSPGLALAAVVRLQDREHTMQAGPRHRLARALRHSRSSGLRRAGFVLALETRRRSPTSWSYTRRSSSRLDRLRRQERRSPRPLAAPSPRRDRDHGGLDRQESPERAFDGLRIQLVMPRFLVEGSLSFAAGLGGGGFTARIRADQLASWPVGSRRGMASRWGAGPVKSGYRRVKPALSTRCDAQGAPAPSPIARQSRRCASWLASILLEQGSRLRGAAGQRAGEGQMARQGISRRNFMQQSAAWAAAFAAGSIGGIGGA